MEDFEVISCYIMFSRCHGLENLPAFLVVNRRRDAFKLLVLKLVIFDIYLDMFPRIDVSQDDILQSTGK